MEKIISFLLLSLIFIFPSVAMAYTTGMSASFVIGQPDFVTNTGTVSDKDFDQPLSMTTDGTRVLVDNGQRVLIYNHVPTQNYAPADVVIGQPVFNSNTANNGGISASSLSCPCYVATDGTHIAIADTGNKRVLIWNSFPTTNGKAADVVVGQTDFVTATSGVSSTKLSANIAAVAFYNGKLLIGDTNSGRLLIYNSIPTTNGAAADVVVGQPDMTTFNATLSTSSTHFGKTGCAQGPRGIAVYNNILFATDPCNLRVLVWNSIPTTNGAAADLVLGQPDFTSSTSDNGGLSCASMDSGVMGVSVTSNGRLIIGDSARVLVYNQIPTTNFAPADLVIGQTNCTTRSSGISASTFSNSPMRSNHQAGDNLLVADQSNRRVLIFNNIVRGPGLSLAGSPTHLNGSTLRQFGTAVSDPLYVIHSVEYSVNGGSFSSAVPTDGTFDGVREDFHIDFDPTLNQPRDSHGDLIAGYTLRLRSFNNNVDVTDHLFYFSPFTLISPLPNAVVSTAHPTFTFSVNRQREVLRDNLSKYQLVVKKGGSDPTTGGGWQTVIENIPVDFSTHKGDTDNTLASTYSGLSTNNGTYETKDFKAVYSNESSTVSVTPKTTSLYGYYSWKIQAVDPAGHIQETDSRKVSIQVKGMILDSFPLSLTNISGVGNPHLSSFIPFTMQNAYISSSTHPTFTGITYAGSTVRLTLTDTITGTTKTYTVIATPNSRYTLSIPKSDLIRGKIYMAELSSQRENKYTEVPGFTVRVR
ncbi:MAG TPA: hypothetical protein VLH19_03025 [Patescibacteria group bacterium]|nr:hypothetical protein [Patescibacteria group bacterium]